MSTLTIKEAAHHFDVSERTIRRRIAAGELRATRAPMAQGYQVFVQLDDNLDTGVDKVVTPGAATAERAGHDKVDSERVQVDNAPTQPVEVFLPTVRATDAATNETLQHLTTALVEQTQMIAELSREAGQYKERAAHLEQELERYKAEVDRLRRRNYWQWLLGR